MSEAALAPLRCALICCGVEGQDGAYLARFLLSKGYESVGSLRDATSMNRHDPKLLQIDRRIEVDSMTPNDDFRSVLVERAFASFGLIGTGTFGSTAQCCDLRTSASGRAILPPASHGVGWRARRHVEDVIDATCAAAKAAANCADAIHG